MKSIIQEGPSLAKAIEQGWLKAGKPKEFRIKIFQEPKKNFLGFTTSIAKIGIFFEEKDITQTKAVTPQAKPKTQEYQQKGYKFQQRPRQQQQQQQQQRFKKK